MQSHLLTLNQALRAPPMRAGGRVAPAIIILLAAILVPTGSHVLAAPPGLACATGAGNQVEDGIFDPGFPYLDTDHDRLFTSGIDMPVACSDVRDGSFDAPGDHSLVITPSVGTIDVPAGPLRFTTNGNLVLAVALGTTGPITLSAGRDIDLMGNRVRATQGAIDIDAGNDILANDARFFADDGLAIGASGDYHGHGVLTGSVDEITITASGSINISDADMGSMGPFIVRSGGALLGDRATIVALGATEGTADGDVFLREATVVSQAPISFEAGHALNDVYVQDLEIYAPGPLLATATPQCVGLIGTQSRGTVDNGDDGTCDRDTDGLSDTHEDNIHGTDPKNADTDGDRLSDAEEVKTDRTDPNDPDTDDDGVTDGDEVLMHGTDPLVDGTEFYATVWSADARGGNRNAWLNVAWTYLATTPGSSRGTYVYNDTFEGSGGRISFKSIGDQWIRLNGTDFKVFDGDVIELRDIRATFTARYNATAQYDQLRFDGLTAALVAHKGAGEVRDEERTTQTFGTIRSDDDRILIDIVTKRGGEVIHRQHEEILVLLSSPVPYYNDFDFWKDDDELTTLGNFVVTAEEGDYQGHEGMWVRIQNDDPIIIDQYVPIIDRVICIQAPETPTNCGQRPV